MTVTFGDGRVFCVRTQHLAIASGFRPVCPYSLVMAEVLGTGYAA